MPTKQEKMINELYKYFGIFSYDVLSDYEKAIYSKIHGTINTVEERRDELKKEYEKHTYNSLYVGQYVDELKSSDEYIKRTCEQIDTLNLNNKEIKDEISTLEKPIEDLEKESSKYQERIDELNKQIEKANKKFQTELEEQKKKIDSKLLNREVEITKRKTEIKVRLSDYEIEESRTQNYVDKLVAKKQASIQRLTELKPSSKEYANLSKEIEKMNSDIELYSNNLNILRTEIPKVLKEAEDIDKELNDDTTKNSEYQKAIEKYNKDLYSKTESLKAKLLDESTKKAEVDKKLEEQKNHKNDLEDKIYKNTNEITHLEKRCLSYAKEDALNKRDAVRNDMKELDQYEVIEKALNNRTPKITSTGIVNGLSIVTKSYKDYYNNHSSIGRFFKFLPFTSAHRDYALFDEIRRRYMDLSNIKQTEIDHYLDHNELTGELLEKSNVLDTEVVDKIHINGVVMDKRTYKMNELASTKDYLKAAQNIYDKEICVAQKNMGYAFVAADKGLLLLNELGNIRRTDGSKEVDDLIKKISNVTKQYGSFGKRSEIISLEIENALKPENEREKLTFEMPSFLKEMYDSAKAEEQKKLDDEDNAILFGNEKTFAKITVNEAENEEENEIEEENLNESNEIDNSLEMDSLYK